MPITDQLYFGMSFNAPYGFSTTSETPWVGMFSHLDAEAKSVNVTPVLGFKFNDMISVAVGMQVEYFDVDIETALAPTAAPPRQRLEGNSTDVGFVAGVTLTPFDGTTIGIGYRSMVKHSLDGSQTFDVPLRTPLGTIPAGAYPITADVTLPDTAVDRRASAHQRRFHCHGRHGVGQLEPHSDRAVRRVARPYEPGARFRRWMVLFARRRVQVQPRLDVPGRSRL